MRTLALLVLCFVTMVTSVVEAVDPPMQLRRGPAVIPHNGTDVVIPPISIGEIRTLTYLIENLGAVPFRIIGPPRAVTTNPPAVVGTTAWPAGDINPSGPAGPYGGPMTVTISPSVAGLLVIEMEVDIQLVPAGTPYTFRWTIVTQVVDPPPDPDIIMSRTDPAIDPMGSGSTYTVPTVGTVGTPIWRQYVVTNLGRANLSFTPPILYRIRPGSEVNCTVNLLPPGTNFLYSLATGESQVLTMYITPTMGGDWGCVLEVFTNDPDTPVYTIRTIGRAQGVPVMAVSRGSTIPVGGTDAAGAIAQDFTTVFTYTVTATSTGYLEFAAPTLTPSAGVTATVHTALTPPIDPGEPQVFRISVRPALGTTNWTVGVSIPFDTNTGVAGVQPYTWTLSSGSTPAFPPFPIIAVRRASTIADGGVDNQYNLTVNMARSVIYTIENRGTAALTLGAVSLGALVNAAATVDSQPTGPLAAPTDSLAPYNSTTFTVTFSGTVEQAVYEIPVSIVNNDNGTHDFTIRGEAKPPPKYGEANPPCGLGNGFTVLLLGGGLLLAAPLRRRG